MPCERCGSCRVITRLQVLCPTCDKISVLNTKEAIESRKQQLQELDSKLRTELDSCDYNCTFGSAVMNRELAAKAVINLPYERRNMIKDWLAYTYLLRNLTFNGTKGNSDFFEILRLCTAAVQLRNEICSLEKGLAVVVNSAGTPNLEWTEREPLEFVPEATYQTQGSKLTLSRHPSEDRNVESLMFNELFMHGVRVLLLSEEISHFLRRSYHSRILPFVNDKYQARSFVRISRQISTDFLADNRARHVDARYEGIKLVDESGLQQLKRDLSQRFQHDEVEQYFANFIQGQPSDAFDLSRSIIARDKQNGLISLPLYTLRMLAYASTRRINSPSIGRASNLKGESMEDYMYVLANCYNLSLKHPITGKPLLRVEHPEQQIEIADLMGYNNRNVLVLECKFWDSPFLVDLDDQLHKFEKKLQYIRDNLQRFGLNQALEVIPIFYTPYAPYPFWHGIHIIPTALGVGMKLGETFSTKKVELLDEVPGTQALLDRVHSPVHFPIDLSFIADFFPQDKYNIQDGIVLEYNETEATALIDMPMSPSPFVMYLDITSRTYCKLKQEGISTGDIIRMILVNLNGTWSMHQLLCFRAIMRRTDWESDTKKRHAYARVISMLEHMTTRERMRVGTDQNSDLREK